MESSLRAARLRSERRETCIPCRGRRRAGEGRRTVKPMLHIAQLGDRRVQCMVTRSPTARKIRVRVGLKGVEVVQPRDRSTQELDVFLRGNEGWLLEQLERVARLQPVRTMRSSRSGQILLDGA